MSGFRRRYKENTTLQRMAKLIADTIIVICAAYMVMALLCTRAHIIGNSMNDLLSNGQTVLINKLPYAFTSPKRYDVIAFEASGVSSSRIYVKRVIGLPGETVQILSGMVYIDGMRLDEHYGDEIMENPGIAEEPLTLGEDEYFVLGDNRNNSSDSRASDVGLINRKDLIGRAWIRVWPLSQIGVIHHE